MQRRLEGITGKFLFCFVFGRGFRVVKIKLGSHEHSALVAARNNLRGWMFQHV